MAWPCSTAGSIRPAALATSSARLTRPVGKCFAPSRSPRWTARRDQLRQRTLRRCRSRHAYRHGLRWYPGRNRSGHRPDHGLPSRRRPLDLGDVERLRRRRGGGPEPLPRHRSRSGRDRAAVNIDTGEVLWRAPDDTLLLAGRVRRRWHPRFPVASLLPRVLRWHTGKRRLPHRFNLHASVALRRVAYAHPAGRG